MKKYWYSKYGKIQEIILYMSTSIETLLTDGAYQELSNNPVRYVRFPTEYNLTINFKNMKAKYTGCNLPDSIYIELKRRPKYYINRAKKIDWDKFTGHDIEVAGYLFKMTSFTEIL